jgi:hypothetical protein
MAGTNVAAALLLEADTFWTFDAAQCALARAVAKFKHVPKLPTA